MYDADLDLLSTAPAAAILGVSRDTLMRYARKGLIPCHRTPTGHRRFRRADVEALRDANREATA